MTQYSGKIIRRTPVTPTQQTASGVWSHSDVTAAVKADSWPVAGVPCPISRSLRFRRSASAFLNRTFGTPTSSTKWTWSGWVKRGTLGTEAQQLFSAGSAIGFFRFSATDTLVSGWTGATNLETVAVFRDPSAWYHVVLSVDTTQTTAANRVRYYVNGAQITVFATTDYPAQNSATVINSAVAHNIGAYQSAGQYFDGYLAEVNFIDGQALTPTAFATTDSQTGAWIPMQYTGTYGANGFRLNFRDNSSLTAIAADVSGNGNNWTTNNISLTNGATYDSVLDVPTQWIGYNTGDVAGATRGNYAVLNAAQDSGSLTLANLRFSGVSGGYSGRKSTIALPTTGKWYWETAVTTQNTGAGNWFIVGMCTGSLSLTSFTGGVANAISYGDRNDSRGIYNETTTVTTSSAIDFITNDILQCAYDAGTGKFWFGKNNAWWDSSAVATGDPANGTNQTLTVTTKEWFPYVQINEANNIADINFGQRPFAYTPPAGFRSLCSTNLPVPSIVKGNQHFDVTLFAGSLSGGTVTNNGMQPSFVWLKARDISQNHFLLDAVRGGDRLLYSNLTDAEGTNAQLITSFNNNGFTYGNALTSNNSYVAWQWRAGGAAVTNTAGSIISQVSANTSAGFSIVTYTGIGANATVGHGLGVVPKMIIVKDRDTAGNNWKVWHPALSGTEYLLLNLTNAKSTAAATWNSTTPTSTVFSLGTDTEVNGVGLNVAYCFAEVAGYSKFGSYTGNGSTDGPFVYLGFRPRFVMVKSSSSSEPWNLVDTSRDSYNVMANYLQPNSSNAEGTIAFLDSLSNGFKLRSSASGFNASGGTYIYAAFAETPFKYSNAR